MRLKEYITESIDNNTIDKFMNNVEKNCRHWLSAIKNCKNKKLYRGYNGSDIDKKNVRTDRKPTDMSSSSHVILDDMFYKKFGWQPRSEGLFATTQIGVTWQYGQPGLCFPAGNFKYIWNPHIVDLYSHISNYGMIDNVDNYTDKNLHKYMNKSNCEIMIKCKSYYIINGLSLITHLKTVESEKYLRLTLEEAFDIWIKENLL